MWIGTSGGAYWGELRAGLCCGARTDVKWRVRLLLATGGCVLLLLLTGEACLCGNSQYSLPYNSDR